MQSCARASAPSAPHSKHEFDYALQYQGADKLLAVVLDMRFCDTSTWTVAGGKLRQAVVEAGALPLLVAAMCAHAECAAVQETARKALRNITTHANTHRQAASAGALPQLAAAMRAHACSAAVCEAACGALGNMAAHLKALRQAVVDAGVLPLLVAAMREHAGNAAVQDATCNTLGNVTISSDDALQKAVMDAGALPRLVAAMHAYAGSAAVQGSVCRALWGIAINSEARTRLVISTGALTLLNSAIKAHAENAHLQTYGASLVRMLSGTLT
jgi:hypothetical protein